MKGRIPWARVLVEGALIVGSILIAFWIDAWWDRTQDQAQAESLLISLLDDFDAAETLLDTIESQHQRLVENGRRLIEYGEVGSVPDSERISVDSLLGSHFLRPVYEPPMGTVESLLSSGRLDLFDNAALLASLTNWTAAVANLQRTESDTRQHFYDRIYPYLAARIDIEDLDKGFADYLGHPLPFEQGRTDAYLLLTDRELQNMLYTHWVLGTNALELDIPLVREALDEIRQETVAEVSR
jgi:hypothetical protein